MVKDADVDQGQGIAQAAGDEFIGAAWLGDSRGVIVGEDQCCGIVRERLAHHLSRMHARAVDGAAKQFVEGDQTVPVIEVEAAEHLVGPIAQLCGQETARFGR